MERPKVTREQFARLAATGEADKYLRAHSESAAVYDEDGRPNGFDVILDTEAGNELFRSISGGRVDLQSATPEELQRCLNDLAVSGRPLTGQSYCGYHWRAAVKRCCIWVGGVILLCALMTLSLFFLPSPH
jgi:hypothetical protein